MQIIRRKNDGVSRCNLQISLNQKYNTRRGNFTQLYNDGYIKIANLMKISSRSEVFKYSRQSTVELVRRVIIPSMLQ